MIIAIDIRLIGKHRTGDEAVFRSLTKAFLEVEREAQIFLLTDETDSEKLVALRETLGVLDGRNAEVISLSAANRYSWNFFVVPKFLRSRSVDIFHTQYILPFFTPNRTKLFAHIHDVSFKVFPELIGWKDRFFLSLLIPRTLRIADRIIAVSEFTKEEIITRYGVASDRIIVVPNAPGAEYAQRAASEAVNRVREQYALPSRFVLAVGTMQPRKNIPFLIQAFAMVKKRIPDLKLVLVGKRYGYRYDRAIDRAIEETGMEQDVVFPGYVSSEDLPAVYTAASAFVFPSHYEGFGIPILEAFSQGTPVVASDILPSREVAGDAALFFGEDIAQAAEMLYNVVIDENLRSRLSSRGKIRALSFSWEKSACLLRDYFRQRSNH